METVWLWIGFNIFVLLMLALDLGVFHRRPHAISLRESATWSVVWVLVALAFNLALWQWSGRTAALEFFTGYLIERALSMDNIFVFVVLFRYFAVEPRYQHRVLFWGIFGALLMRGAMIGLGVALIQRFEWVLYLFGAFLVYAGAKMMFHKDEAIHPERNPVLRWARKFLPLTRGYEGQSFFVRDQDVWRATPLFLVLLVVETTDLAFAVDSIPAIFAITRDPFIIYTSNVFAILGLRAFYFLLAALLPYFRYLNIALSIVLIFVGAKMLGEKWVHIPTHISLAIVGGVLSVAVIASVMAARAKARTGRAAETAATERHPTAVDAAPADELAVQLARLASRDSAAAEAAAEIYRRGRALGDAALDHTVPGWRSDAEVAPLFAGSPTVGLAVQPSTFEQIRATHGSPRLAEVPPDQDAEEFELHFSHGARLDVLTAKAPGRAGAIARFLEKFGEGIQQVEYPVIDVDRAAELLRARFGVQPIYPQTRPGADGTRVNFFLARTAEGQTVLIELVEAPRVDTPSPAA